MLAIITFLTVEGIRHMRLFAAKPLKDGVLLTGLERLAK